jgi:hypothetical protein
MNEPNLDTWITNYESGQRQKHAQFLRGFKLEFYKLRLEQERQRRALLHHHHGAAPPPSVETQRDRRR